MSVCPFVYQSVSIKKGASCSSCLPPTSGSILHHWSSLSGPTGCDCSNVTVSDQSQIDPIIRPTRMMKIGRACPSLAGLAGVHGGAYIRLVLGLAAYRRRLQISDVTVRGRGWVYPTGRIAGRRAHKAAARRDGGVIKGAAIN